MKKINPRLTLGVVALATLGCALSGGSATDYFPTSAGTTWHYKIALGQVRPVVFSKVWSPLGDHFIVRDTRRLLRPESKGGATRTFNLGIRVKGPCVLPPPIHGLEGVEIEILEDELGVFGDNPLAVYWAVDRQDRLSITEVVVSRSATSGYGAYDQARKLLFFEEEAGTVLTTGSDATEQMGFLGSEKRTMHFRREIQATTLDNVPSHIQGREALECSITQDAWFGAGKGLTRLVQTQSGRAAMTWELVHFSSGR